MTERRELKFEIPEGTPEARCKGCGAAIFWIVTEAGKRAPLDPDGTSHFATCSEAKRFRKR